MRQAWGRSTCNKLSVFVVVLAYIAAGTLGLFVDTSLAHAMCACEVRSCSWRVVDLGYLQDCKEWRVDQQLTLCRSSLPSQARHQTCTSSSPGHSATPQTKQLLSLDISGTHSCPYQTRTPLQRFQFSDSTFKSSFQTGSAKQHQRHQHWTLCLKAVSQQFGPQQTCQTQLHYCKTMMMSLLGLQTQHGCRSCRQLLHG